MERPAISFDGEGKLRVLDAEIYKQTEELEKEARSFVSKVQEFNDTVHGIVDNLQQQAAKIEHEKLKAIGQRNLVDNERELRKRKIREVQALIDERNAELARLTAEYDALAKVELEQKDMIEKLLNNEPGGV